MLFNVYSHFCQVWLQLHRICFTGLIQFVFPWTGGPRTLLCQLCSHTDTQRIFVSSTVAVSFSVILIQVNFLLGSKYRKIPLISSPLISPPGYRPINLKQKNIPVISPLVKLSFPYYCCFSGFSL